MVDSQSQDTATSTQKAIFQATLELIEQEPIENISMRRIAAKAQVNLAAINYHFGSKQKLLTQCLLHVTSIGMDQMMQTLGDATKSPKERLHFYVSFMLTLFDQSRKESHLVLMSQIQMQNPEDNPLHQHNMRFSQMIFQILREIAPETTDQRLKYIQMQLESSLNYPFLGEVSMRHTYGFSLCNPTQRTTYLEYLYDSTLTLLETKP